MRRSVGRVLLAVLAIATPARAEDAFPSRDATSFQAVRLTLQEGDQVVVWCQDSNVGDFGTTFDAFTIESPDRGVYGSGATAGTSGSITGVAVRVGKAGLSKRLFPPSYGGLSWGGGSSWFQVLEDGSILTAAWASWGDAVQNCGVDVNDREVLPRVLSGHRAIYRMSTDFNGGAAAIAGADVAVGQRLRRSASGYLFAWLAAGRSGWVEMESPDGAVYGGPGHGDALVATETDGVWEYRLQVSTNDFPTPALWLMEIPE